MLLFFKKKKKKKKKKLETKTDSLDSYHHQHISSSGPPFSLSDYIVCQSHQSIWFLKVEKKKLELHSEDCYHYHLIQNKSRESMMKSTNLCFSSVMLEVDRMPIALVRVREGTDWELWLEWVFKLFNNSLGKSNLTVFFFFRINGILQLMPSFYFLFWHTNFIF